MNTFYEHHENSIRFGYRCFDRILIDGLIHPFQQPERVVGLFNTYRQQYPVSKAALTDITTQYQRWVIAHANTWAARIVEAPAGVVSHDSPLTISHVGSYGSAAPFSQWSVCLLETGRRAARDGGWWRNEAKGPALRASPLVLREASDRNQSKTRPAP